MEKPRLSSFERLERLRVAKVLELVRAVCSNPHRRRGQQRDVRPDCLGISKVGERRRRPHSHPLVLVVERKLSQSRSGLDTTEATKGLRGKQPHLGVGVLEQRRDRRDGVGRTQV